MPELGYQTASLPGWAGMAAESNETNPDLVWPKSNDTYERMCREDPQVMSVMRAVTLPVQETEWRLDATGVRDEVAQQIATDLGLAIVGKEPTAPLRTKGRFSFEEFLRLALLELRYGHSIFEQVYSIDAFGRTHLDKLAWRPPRTISEFEVARDGGLVAVKQFGAGLAAPVSGRSNFVRVPTADVRIPVDRLVVFVNEREGGNWVGTSMLRPAYKMWLLKDRTLRVQALAAERNGLGLPVYTSAAPPDNASYEDKLAWLDAEIERGLGIAKGARAGDAAGASLPNGAGLALVGVKGNLPDLDKQIRYYDEQIARIALANFLNLGGDNSTGSYALGDTFESFFTKSLNALARHIATTVNQHVIEDLVDKNWGTQEPAPRIVPPKIGAEHPATAEAIRALLESGAIRWNPALEAHLRALYGLPVMDATATAPRQPEEAA
ncbi:hypothetical protein [Microbacterium sp. NPDC080220]|uniref:phage portal protein family protein n=1 Tax=Microbacterium sp. NPDC080220 TaxID=3161017 RepID=UPI00343C6777